jgi:hypothetical protein
MNGRWASAREDHPTAAPPDCVRPSKPGLAAGARCRRRGAHLLICEPAARRLHELFLRSADRRWLGRTYKTVNEGDVDDAGKFGAEGLLQAGADRTSFEVITSLDSVVGRLLGTIESERAAIT